MPSGNNGYRAGPGGTKALRKNALSFDQIDLVELNEAFAAQVLAVLKAWNWHYPTRLNVSGSGISLGHPIGATGMRTLTTLLHDFDRRQGGPDRKPCVLAAAKAWRRCFRGRKR